MDENFVLLLEEHTLKPVNYIRQMTIKFRQFQNNSCAFDGMPSILHILHSPHSFIMFGSRCWIYKHSNKTLLNKIQNKTEYTNSEPIDGLVVMCA